MLLAALLKDLIAPVRWDLGRALSTGEGRKNDFIFKKNQEKLKRNK